MSASNWDPRLRRSLAYGALGAAALVSARALLRPNAARTRRLLDWDAVRRIALQRSGRPAGRVTAARRERLSAQYQQVAEEMAPWLAEVCDTTDLRVPHFFALDREGFIDVNIAIVQRLLEPVEKLRATIPESAGTALSRRLMNRYVGELLGLMSRRVLGQFDPVLMMEPVEATVLPEATLYLVEPNVAELQREHHLHGESLRRWIILHELTHAWQFAQHPWLREHIMAMLHGLIIDSIKQPGGGLRDAADLVQNLPATVRTQVRTVTRLQALMSVLEGYSNFVMHHAGRTHIREADDLEAAMRQRRRQRTALERLVLSLTGLEVKLRQYEVGERFCVAVADAAGLDSLNRVWESADMMPTNTELRYPDRWIARTR